METSAHEQCKTGPWLFLPGVYGGLITLLGIKISHPSRHKGTCVEDDLTFPVGRYVSVLEGILLVPSYKGIEKWGC